MSQQTDEIVEMERRFWREANNPQYFQDAFADDGMTIFEPVGVVEKPRALVLAGHSKPWDEVHMQDITVRELAPNCIALTYRGTAKREGDVQPYHARISSIYLQRSGRWQRVFTAHQPWDPKTTMGTATPARADTVIASEEMASSN
ncbi:MAG: hypothetical protein JWM32_1659 [Verrucomicrobia bacterium]|nr:hypothetical protein [Verrucomicrobiota bacterium]